MKVKSIWFIFVAVFIIILSGPEKLGAEVINKHLTKANDLMSKGEIDSAIVEYQKALRSDRKSTEARLWLGIAYERQGNRCLDNGEAGRAIDAYQNALRYQPDSVRTQSWLGLAYARLGNQLSSGGEIDRAMEAYQHALAAVPEEPYWHEQLGVMWEKKNDREAALKEYRLAAGLCPLDEGLERRYDNLLHGTQGSGDADVRMAKTGERIETVGGEVSAPTVIENPDPSYSARAREARLQGQLVLSVVVDRDGKVAGASIVKPLGLGLDAKALETVRGWQFQPGTRNGTPVPVRVIVEISFKLF